MSRNRVILSGGIGLAGGLLLTAGAVYVVAQALIPPFLTRPILVWGLFLFLLVLSLLEIPLMIFSMRRMAASDKPKAQKMVLLTIAAYTLFAAVYAVPFIVLAGHARVPFLAGLFLAALIVLRFISAVIFLPYDKQP